MITSCASEDIEETPHVPEAKVISEQFQVSDDEEFFEASEFSTKEQFENLMVLQYAQNNHPTTL